LDQEDDRQGIGLAAVMIRALGFKIISWALMLGGLGWVFYLLYASLNDPRLLIPASWGWFGLSTTLVGFSIALNGIVFYLFLHPAGKKEYPLFQVLELHYSAQLLRYLPGRVWGILYQVSAARGSIPAIRIARANLDWMIFSMLGNSLVAVLLIGFQQSWPIQYVLLILVAGTLIIGGTLLGGVSYALRIPRHIMPKRLHEMITTLSQAKLTLSQFIATALVFMLSWAFYLIGWILLEKVYPQFSGIDFVSLCAFYSLAATIGIVSAITPAGIGVREAAFLLLTTGTSPPELAAIFAVFARLWLLVIDLGLLSIPACIYLRNRSRTHDTAAKP
jgi:hypothetical protein